MSSADPVASSGVWHWELDMPDANTKSCVLAFGQKCCQSPVPVSSGIRPKANR